MPRSRGRRRRREGGRQFEQKATARPTQQPPIQKTISPTATTGTARRQYPTQQVDTSLSHVRGDIIRVGVVTTICILLLVVLWAVLR
jgi:hypothetical protein